MRRQHLPPFHVEVPSTTRRHKTQAAVNEENLMTMDCTQTYEHKFTCGTIIPPSYYRTTPHQQQSQRSGDLRNSTWYKARRKFAKQTLQKVSIVYNP